VERKLAGCAWGTILIACRIQDQDTVDGCTGTRGVVLEFLCVVRYYFIDIPFPLTILFSFKLGEKMIAKYRDRNRFGSIFQPEDVCD